MPVTTVATSPRRPYRAPRQLGGRTAGGPARRHTGRMAFLFLLPALVVLAAFVFWPVLSALRLSFTDSSGFGVEHYVGFKNYVEVFTSSRILGTLGVTALYAVMFTPVTIAVALALALLLNRRNLWGRGFFRTAFFLPFIVSMAVAAFAWEFLLDPQIGLVNYWLRSAGVRLGNVLQDPHLALPTVVLVAVWKGFGFYMVIFIAGLQDIPGDLYEAARIDGANAWQRFAHVTLPQLSTTLAFVVIFALIAAFQAFDQIYVLTGGGPYRHTQTMVMEVYQEGFKKLNIGLASAISYVLLLITLVFSLVQFRFFNRREEAVVG